MAQLGFKDQGGWQGNVGTFKVSAMGMGASRSVVVLDDKVEVTIKLPLAAMIMKPLIDDKERQMKQELEEILRA